MDFFGEYQNSVTTIVVMLGIMFLIALLVTGVPSTLTERRTHAAIKNLEKKVQQKPLVNPLMKTQPEIIKAPTVPPTLEQKSIHEDKSIDTYNTIKRNRVALSEKTDMGNLTRNRKGISMLKKSNPVSMNTTAKFA